MADVETVDCTTMKDGMAAGDVHAISKEQHTPSDVLKGGEVDAHGDAPSVVTSENGCDTASVTETAADNSTPTVVDAEPSSESTTTETCADTTDSSSQTGTKRKTDDVDDNKEAEAEVKKVKTGEEQAEPAPTEQQSVDGSEATAKEAVPVENGTAETNGKLQDNTPEAEIVAKSVDDVINADHQPVEAS